MVSRDTQEAGDRAEHPVQGLPAGRRVGRSSDTRPTGKADRSEGTALPPAVDFIELLFRREQWARNGFDDSYDRRIRYGLLDGEKRRG
jgi:hypothetical protein